MAYSTTTKSTDAKVFARSLTISTKKSVEICQRIRGMRLENAKALLAGAVDHTRTLDGKKHYDKVSAAILGVLESAESNAKNKGLNTKNLLVFHAAAQKGGNVYRPTRMRFKVGPFRLKNTHIEIVLREVKSEAKEKKPEAKKEAKQ
jgi:large subunit ribosomal protein L22